ncbi:MAG: type II toxin-antitoxin system VapC family toxin [Candidatus Poribacteria bacterium]|nr:type II toxin-antitoxin system VapC family toxin [Candidatus Poribacteria bacterium]
MKYLLDTHTLLWFLKGDKKLSDKARQLIDNPRNSKFLSIASLWEIAVKVSLGKLVLDKPFERLFPEQLYFNRIEVLDITVDSLIKLTTLPFHHRDPFDRLIIAQALVEDLPIIGTDAAFDAYEISREW